MSRLFYFEIDRPQGFVGTNPFTAIGKLTISSFVNPDLRLFLPLGGGYSGMVLADILQARLTFPRGTIGEILFTGVRVNSQRLDYDIVLRWKPLSAFYINANAITPPGDYPLLMLLTAGEPVNEAVITAEIVDPRNASAVERSRELRFEVVPHLLKDPVATPSSYMMSVGDDMAPFFSVGDRPLSGVRVSSGEPPPMPVFYGAWPYEAQFLQSGATVTTFTQEKVRQQVQASDPSAYLSGLDITIQGTISPLSLTDLGDQTRIVSSDLTTTLGVNSPARWLDFPDLPSPSRSPTGTQAWPMMPQILHARKASDKEFVQLTLTSNQPQLAFEHPYLPLLTSNSGRVEVPLTVNPTALTCTFKPATEDTLPGTSKMVLEYNWIGNELAGKLVGSFDLVVERPAAYPGGEPLHIFDCDFIIQIGQVDNVVPGRVRLLDIYLSPDADTSGVSPPRRRIPFDLELEITNTSPAGTPAPADFNLDPLGFINGVKPDVIRGSLRRLIMAAHSGTARLHVHLLPPRQQGSFAFPDQLFVGTDIYDLPADPQPIDIEVPEPLVLHLEEWRDDAFPPSASLDLSSTPRSEIIYSKGELLGKVDNWGRQPPVPDLQRLSLEIATDFGAQQLRRLEGVTSTGAFAEPVDDLRTGSNLLRVSAWKPINIVMDGQPAVAEATLVGVLPSTPTLHLPAPLTSGSIVLRRGLSGLEATYGRATSVHLMYRRESSGTGTRLASFPPSYGSTRATVPGITLQRETGSHFLQLRAVNDFGETPGFTSSFNAPAPNIVIDPQTEGVPHDPERLYDVGNSVTMVNGFISFQYALDIEFFQDGVSRFRRVVRDADALQLREESMRFPERGSFQEGIGMLFRLAASNEFTPTPIDSSVTITRRPFVYTFRNLNLELGAVDTNAHLIVEEIRPDVLATETNSEEIDQNYQGFRIVLDNVDTSSPTGIESISFAVERDLDSRGRPRDRDAKLDFVIDYQSGECIGPDYERFANFLSTHGETVDEDYSIPFPIDLVVQVGLNLDNRYWTRVRVISQSSTRTIYLAFARWR